LLKGVLEKIFSGKQKSSQAEPQPVSYDQVQAIVDERIKEHTAAFQTGDSEKVDKDEENYKLTEKQRVYALTLIERVNHEFELSIDPAELTVKDLNRLIAYNRYKNKGTLVNLVKKGVLRKI
jgi:hypothetical protein